jgi:RND family efflux transporter MFP subunit
MSRVAKLKTLFGYLPKVLGALILGLIIIWMSYGFHARVQPGEAQYARPRLAGRPVVPVRTLTTVETISAVGTVRPRQKTEVASQLLATIQEVTVRAGDRVEAGQPLVTLDDREIQAQLREAEAAVSGVEADLSVRERDYTRYRRMFSENAVTKEDFDRIEGAYQVTAAQVQRAREQVARMRVMLSYTSIRAQKAGIVSDRYADPGDLAAPGKALLAIHDPTELELHADVGESLAADVRLAEQLRVKVDAAHLDALGTVREIVPRAEAASRSVLVKVSLPQEAKQQLYIGMFGRLEIAVGRLDRVVVAANAVQRIGQLDVVDVVLDDQTLQRRYIRVGRRFDDDAEVLSGLRVGEQVAIPGPGALGSAAPHRQRLVSAASSLD